MSDDTNALTPERRRLLELMLREREQEKSLRGRLEKRPPSEPLELSFAQQRLWFIQRLQPELAAYNIPAAVRLSGPLDVAVLQRAVDEVVRRHETLRTRFAFRDGRPVPVVAQEREVPLQVEDLRREGASPAELAEAVQGRVDRLARVPFDLAEDDLLRLHLFRTAQQEHVLLVVLHHVVSDTWTTGIFLREITALYGAFVAGRPSPLEELTLQYTDYASWQRRLIRDDGLEREIEYWTRQLADAPQLLELPTDRPRPAVQSFRGGRQLLHLPRRLTDALKELGAKQEASLFMALLALYQVVLSRFTGQRDVLVGSPIANRDRVELEGMIGLFVNTLVLRTRVEGSLSFRQLLEQVREMCLGGFAHKELPFEKLVEELELDRDTGRNPLFQTLFAFQNVPIPELVAEGLTLERFEFRESTCRLDLELDLQEMPHGFVGWLGYNSDLFDAATAGRMTDAFRHLLEAVLAEPDRALDRLPVMGPAARHQVLVEWNDTRVEGDREHTLHGLVEARVETSPDAPAVEGAGQRLTYRELDAAANRLAHELRDAGVRAGDRVGVHLDRTPRMAVAVLGIHKAGAAYVPLDRAFPGPRLAAIAEEAGLRRVVSEASRLETLAPVADFLDTVVCLDVPGEERPAGLGALHLVDGDALAARPATAPPAPRDPDLPAYVIFTSGSTGRPKGVLVAHRAAAHLVRWINAEFAVTAQDRLLFVTALSFDLSVYDLFGTLAAGGTVRVATEDEQAEPAEMVRILREEGITFWDSAPAALQRLVPSFPAGPVADSALRLVFLSGDWIPLDLPDAVRDVFPGAEVVSLGGATESTVWSNSYRVGEVDPAWPSIPYGRPMDNVAYYVLDRHLEPVPVGVEGDLYAGGACLAEGYLGRPALTAAAFLPDPISGVPGARLYDFGDRARHGVEGVLEFRGRSDHQVKVRGYRIELGEVETVLRRHPLVDGAAVLAWGPATGDRRLVGYVVPRSGEELSRGELRAWIGERLPEYMVPSLFTFLEELPTTSSGKLDRRALPEPEGARPDDLEAAYADPESELERTLAQQWQRLLKVDKVGRHDDFFALGGHSLLLTQVHQELTATTAPDLNLVDLFQYRTVADLAAFLSSSGGDESPLEASRERAQRRAHTAVGGTGGAEVAVVGLAVRVPGANDAARFWNNLREGLECISFFSEEEVLAAGVPRERLSHPDYVRAEGEVEDVEGFDAAFFGINPREAEMMDPQHRHFLEVCWEALEDAGYEPRTYPGSIGVFGGVNISSYLFNNLSDYDAVGAMSDFHTRADILLGNQPDFLTTRVSHALGLGGPSIAIQTSCSSALVAVHTASQHLLRQECDMALAGGVQMRVPQRMGYLYREGGLPSPDGHCRSFDASSKGTVHGNGCGLVVLKRLEDAVAEGDHVYAVIRGSSVNNDAGTSVGYTAPSAEGLSRVAAEALAVAGVDPTTVGLLEANGTGTEMGDPIEFTAMARSYRGEGGARNFCALGSVKTSIGHLDTASGVASLVKAALAVRHGEIPPLLHFQRPNPNIDLDSSPFYVNTGTVPWPEEMRPRRAGINNFGVGGTNAHVVIEEAPVLESGPSPRPVQLLPLSARSTGALHRATGRLRDALAEAAGGGSGGFDRGIRELADVAFTLQVGRRAFPVRRLVVARDPEDAAEALESLDPQRVATSFQAAGEPGLVLAFPHLGGAAAVGLGRALVDAEPGFRSALEESLEALREVLSVDDPGGLLHPRPEDLAAARRRASRDGLGDALGVALQHALARLLAQWGLEPVAVVSAGAGDAAAAVAAGVLPLPEALALAAARGRGDRDGVAAVLATADPGTPVLPWFTAALDGAAVDGEHTAAVDFWTADTAGEGLEGALGRLSATGANALLSLGPSPLAQVPPGLEALSLWPGGDGGPSAGEAEALLWAVGRLWLAGLPVDWQAFNAGEDRRRVSLPTYPFEHQRFWREPQVDARAAGPSLDARLEADRWFHAPTWSRSEQPAPPEGLLRGRWLLLDRGGELGEAVAAGLAAAGEVVRVRPGEAFAGSGAEWTVRPGEVEDYRALASALEKAGGRPDRVVHLWCADGPAPRGEAALELGFGSLCLVARGFVGEGGGHPLDLVLVTAGAQDVTGEEELVPELATALGAVRVVPQEYPGVACRAVDLGAPGRPAPRQLQGLMAELARGGTGSATGAAVALRGAGRWVQATEALELPAPEDGATPLPAGGAWLVTGGGGPFAPLLAAALARRTDGARLLLAGRLGLPEREAWDELLTAGDAPREALRRRVAVLRDLESSAAELELLEADTGTPEGIAAAFAAAADRFGDLAGVIHAEESFGEQFACTVEELTRSVVEERLLARVGVLEAVAREVEVRRPGVCVLSSSLAGLLGGLGVVADSAADGFTDLLARERSRTSGTRWLAVGWDAWQGPRGEVTGERLPASGAARHALSSEEVEAVLERILASGAGPQVLVSTVHLGARFDRWVRRQGLPEPAAAGPGGKRRPALTSPFVPPKSELEQLIAGVWRELFGFDEIGVYDDFYELGGHSLLGTQVAVRLRETLQVDLPLRQFLEYTTISDLSKAIAARQVEDAEPEDLESFLAELEGMSEEEAAARVE